MYIDKDSHVWALHVQHAMLPTVVLSACTLLFISWLTTQIPMAYNAAALISAVTGKNANDKVWLLAIITGRSSKSKYNVPL